MKRHWIRTAVLLVFLAAAAGLFAALFFAVKSKKLQINRWVVSPRDVIGVDISEYQADVDMEALAEQNISFIYMKATEGSSYTDSRFRENWENAEEAGIPAGAYHFFSFDSPGKLQAENYVSTVGSISGKLIPAVDVEYYGDKREDPPEPEEVAKELSAFLGALEEEYHVKPMIYCPREIYRKYIAGYLTAIRDGSGASIIRRRLKRAGTGRSGSTVTRENWKATGEESATSTLTSLKEAPISRN